MSLDVIFFLTAGALAGGFINGLAGFGTALFALGWFLQVATPIEAVAMVQLMSVVSGIQGLVLVWNKINWKRLARFLVPALLGIPLGFQLLSFINATTLQTIIALFLIVYGGFFLFKKTLPNFTRPTPVFDSFLGFVAGALGSLAGLSGALPTMWSAMRPWSKAETRALLQPFNIIILGLSTLLLAWNGAFNAQVALNLLIVIPISFAAAVFGIWIFKRLQDEHFRRLLIILLFTSGIILLSRAFF